MANQQLGDRITTALSDCDDSVLAVAQTLGEVLGIWIAEASRILVVTPDEVRAVVEASVDKAIGETLAAPRLFDA